MPSSVAGASPFHSPDPRLPPRDPPCQLWPKAERAKEGTGRNSSPSFVFGPCSPLSWFCFKSLMSRVLNLMGLTRVKKEIRAPTESSKFSSVTWAWLGQLV